MIFLKEAAARFASFFMLYFHKLTYMVHYQPECVNFATIF